MTVAKYTANGLTIDQVKQFYANMCENSMKLNPMYNMTVIDDDEGHPVYHNLTSMSWPMSNRSAVFVEHRREEDGAFTICFSSRGTEDFEKKHASLIGSNVVAKSVIQYARFATVPGGIEITNITAVDPAGSIPQFLKDRVAKRHARSGIVIADFILHGTIPTD